MYLGRIDLNEFKCFERTRVEFCYPGRQGLKTPYPNINLILGNNGSGKTSLLQGIALSILGGVCTNQGLRPRGLVRAKKLVEGVPGVKLESSLYAPDRDEVFRAVIDQRGNENVIDLNRTGKLYLNKVEVPDSLWLADSSEYFLCGYGASRRAAPRANYDPAGRDEERGRRYQRVASLFEEDFELTSVSGWWNESSAGKNGVDPHWDEYVALLRELTEDTGLGLAMRSVDGETYFNVHSAQRKLPFTLLSDGYRAYLSWVCDLIRHLGDVTSEGERLRDVLGIVLVDEIDLHLHPSWQRRILPQLSRSFPNLQFIVTSHSPILAGSVPWENVWQAEIGQNGDAYLTKSDKDYYGKSVDEILTGSYFELQTTLSPRLEAERERSRDRMNKLARAVMTEGDEAAAKAYLEALRES